MSGVNDDNLAIPRSDDDRVCYQERGMGETDRVVQLALPLVARELCLEALALLFREGCPLLSPRTGQSWIADPLPPLMPMGPAAALTPT